MLIRNIYINKIVVSSEVSFGKCGFKYFFSYKDAEKIRRLCTFLPKISAYRSNSYKTKCMYFFIKDEKISEKYYEIWQKVSNVIKKEFDSKPGYNEKYLKTKIKPSNRKFYTNFHIKRNTKRRFSM